jgi:hypothetical protein
VGQSEIYAVKPTTLPKPSLWPYPRERISKFASLAIPLQTTTFIKISQSDLPAAGSLVILIVIGLGLLRTPPVSTFSLVCCAFFQLASSNQTSLLKLCVALSL